MRHLLALAVLLIVPSCGMLDKQVYTQPVDPVTGAPVGMIMPATNPDGTPKTVGDQLADTVDANAGVIAGTGTALLGPAGGAIGGLAALLLAGVLRNRKKQASSPAA